MSDTKRLGISLERMIQEAVHLKQVRKTDLQAGDHLLITTLNSEYSIKILDHDCCLVSGGWFDRKGVSPMQTTILGCTWGGQAIKIDVVAACGLRMEFGNQVLTSAIQRIVVLRQSHFN